MSASPDVSTNGRARLRVQLVGTATGLGELRHRLEGRAEIELLGWSAHAAQAAGVLQAGSADAVLCATPGPSLPADEIAALREHTAVPIVVLASAADPDLFQQALEADVADVLLLPQPPESVVFALLKAAHGERRDEPAPARGGKIVTVFSPKGGTGKSVASTNLAVALAAHENRRTLLLDLDLQFGDCAIMLGIEPEKTIYDLVTAPGELDSEKLAGYITRHSSGLDVLPAPLRPEDAELVTVPKLVRLLEVARECYDVIVVDTSPFFHGPMLATLDHSDELLLLCALDVPTVKDVRVSLHTLDLVSFTPERITLVLNRANAPVGITPGDVESALDVKIRYQLPDDPAVSLAVNRAQPIVLAEAGAPYASAVRQIAAGLFTRPTPKAGRGLRFALGRA